MEAALQSASHPQQPVLLIYADEIVPPVYEDVDRSGMRSNALGILLQSGAARRIECSSVRDGGSDDEGRQALAFIRCLEQGRAEWRGDGRVWQWAQVA